MLFCVITISLKVSPFAGIIFLIISVILVKQKIKSKSSEDEKNIEEFKGKNGIQTQPKSLQAKSAKGRHLDEETSEEKKYNEDLEYLKKKWKEIDETPDIAPHWFFDNSTDRQIKYARKLGIKADQKMTKGQLSDLIGLHNCDEIERFEDILKFFKVSLKGLNSTTAKYKAQDLLSDEKNVKKLNNRPALKGQKDFYRFFNIQIPKGLTAGQAEETISEYEKQKKVEKSNELELFDLYSECISEDLREDRNIKKMSPALFRKAYNALVADIEKSHDADEMDDYIDEEMIIDKAIELKPDLEKD